MIKRTDKTMRLYFKDEEYAIFKHKDLEYYYLEYYKFSKDYMPEMIFCDKSILKVLRKLESIIGD